MILFLSGNMFYFLQMMHVNFIIHGKTITRLNQARVI